MVEMVLEIGHNSKDPRRLGFNLRQDDHEGTVREYNALQDFYRQFQEIISTNHDTELKPQFEIVVTVSRVSPREVKVRTDYRQVPNSGCNMFVISTGMSIYEVVKKACNGKVIISRHPRKA